MSHVFRNYLTEAQIVSFESQNQGVDGFLSRLLTKKCGNLLGTTHFVGSI